MKVKIDDESVVNASIIKWNTDVGAMCETIEIVIPTDVVHKMISARDEGRIIEISQLKGVMKGIVTEVNNDGKCVIDVIVSTECIVDAVLGR